MLATCTCSRGPKEAPILYKRGQGVATLQQTTCARHICTIHVAIKRIDTQRTAVQQFVLSPRQFVNKSAAHGSPHRNKNAPSTKNAAARFAREPDDGVVCACLCRSDVMSKPLYEGDTVSRQFTAVADNGLSRSPREVF